MKFRLAGRLFLCVVFFSMLWMGAGAGAAGIGAMDAALEEASFEARYPRVSARDVEVSEVDCARLLILFKTQQVADAGSKGAQKHAQDVQKLLGDLKEKMLRVLFNSVLEQVVHKTNQLVNDDASEDTELKQRAHLRLMSALKSEEGWGWPKWQRGFFLGAMGSAATLTGMQLIELATTDVSYEFILNVQPWLIVAMIGSGVLAISSDGQSSPRADKALSRYELSAEGMLNDKKFEVLCKAYVPEQFDFTYDTAGMLRVRWPFELRGCKFYSGTERGARIQPVLAFLNPQDRETLEKAAFRFAGLRGLRSVIGRGEMILQQVSPSEVRVSYALNSAVHPSETVVLLAEKKWPTEKVEGRGGENDEAE